MKDLDRLQENLWQRVRDALFGLRYDPRPPNCKKLSTGAYRIRIGDYRAIYDVDDADISLSPRLTTSGTHDW